MTRSGGEAERWGSGNATHVRLARQFATVRTMRFGIDYPKLTGIPRTMLAARTAAKLMGNIKTHASRVTHPTDRRFRMVISEQGTPTINATT